MIQSASFVGSFEQEKDCPQGNLPEFAFIGRSNVGKSSLINMLCNRKDLVKISGTPGKTQTLNFFLINRGFHFVDLPGYGYAKVSKGMRKKWEAMIRDYLTKRVQLMCVFALIDARLEPQQIDLEFINQLGEWQVPFALVFTKIDKEGKAATERHVGLFQERMKNHWDQLPPIFLTSAVKRTGREELLDYIGGILATKNA